MAPSTMSVVYPAGTKFDMDYYLSTHMPLVQKTWSPLGLKSWKVAQYTNDDAPYVVQAWLEFESSEHREKAVASADSKAVFGDIAKFSDKQPALLSGEIKEAKSW